LKHKVQLFWRKLEGAKREIEKASCLVNSILQTSGDRYFNNIRVTTGPERGYRGYIGPETDNILHIKGRQRKIPKGWANGKKTRP